MNYINILRQRAHLQPSPTSRLVFVATLGMVASGILGAMVGANIQTYEAQRAHDAKILAFPYESCKAIVAKGDLDKNPGVPDYWREIKTTPGGNWCIS